MYAIYKRVVRHGVVSWDVVFGVSLKSNPKRVVEALIREGHMQSCPNNVEKWFTDLMSCGMFLNSEVALLIGEVDD